MFKSFSDQRCFIDTTLPAAKQCSECIFLTSTKFVFFPVFKKKSDPPDCRGSAQETRNLPSCEAETLCKGQK